MFALVAPITSQSVNRHPQGAALLFVECPASEPMNANRVNRERAREQGNEQVTSRVTHTSTS